MKRALVVITLLGLTAHAKADNRDAWQAAFAGSATVVAGGVVVWMRGWTQLEDARDELCARGGYWRDPACAQTRGLDAAELERLNRKGDDGQRLANIGLVTSGVGLAVATVAFYKGFVEKRKQERGVVVTPTMTRDGAGATLQLRW